MASSKDKAIALKDNYVAGLIEGGVTSPNPTMPERDMGNVAGDVWHIGRGETYGFNDGNPTRVITDGKVKYKLKSSSAAFPVRGGMGEFGANALDQKTRALGAKILYDGLGTIVELGSKTKVGNDEYCALLQRLGSLLRCDSSIRIAHDGDEKVKHKQEDEHYES